MNSLTGPRLRIIVLAAGMSARLGAPKALARVRGRSLVERAVRLLGSLGGPYGGPIIVVTPANAARIRTELRHCPVRFAANPARARGLSTSVRCGLRAARMGSAALLIPVDLVRLSRRDLVRLIARWRAAPRRVVARCIGPEGGGTPLIVPHWLFPQALALSGDRGLKSLVDGWPRARVTLIDLPSAADDVDTPRDLERARRRWPAEG
jgi:molybdenum cofactor cytidylyltransferase